MQNFFVMCFLQIPSYLGLVVGELHGATSLLTGMEVRCQLASYYTRPRSRLLAVTSRGAQVGKRFMPALGGAGWGAGPVFSCSTGTAWPHGC